MKFVAARTHFGCRTGARTGARTGSVALMLVLILALLVGTFAVSVARRASNERRNELHHQSIAVLDSAIDAVALSDLESDVDLRLPLDKASGRWVIVKSVIGPDAAPQYRATLYHNDQPGISIWRLARSDP